MIEVVDGKPGMMGTAGFGLPSSRVSTFKPEPSDFPVPDLVYYIM